MTIKWCLSNTHLLLKMRHFYIKNYIKLNAYFKNILKSSRKRSFKDKVKMYSSTKRRIRESFPKEHIIK